MVLHIIISNVKPSLYLKQNSCQYGYEILLICIIIGSFVMPMIVKECFRNKISNHFR